MTLTVTIVGASVRAAALSALRARYAVRAADLFADVDLRRACDAMQVADYPAGLSALLSAPHPGGWMYTGALENSPELIAEWSRLRQLWGNPAEVLLRVRQPTLVAAALTQAGLKCPAVSATAKGVPRNGSWLRKPLRSAGGAHIGPLLRAKRQADPQYYFQKRLEGTPCAAVYVAAGGHAVLLGITRQFIGQSWTGARGYQYCGSLGPWEPNVEERDQFDRLGTTLAREFDLVGLFGVDVIVNAQGVWTVEVNPRYTASIEVLERVFEFSPIELQLAACEANQLPSAGDWPRQRASAKAILFATRQLQIPARLMALAAVDAEARPRLADIPAPGATIAAGWPIVTVLADGDTTTEACATLERRCAQVRQCLYAEQ